MGPHQHQRRRRSAGAAQIGGEDEDVAGSAASSMDPRDAPGKGAGEGRRLSRWRGEGAAGWDRATAATLIQTGDGGNEGTELRHEVEIGERVEEEKARCGLREMKEEAAAAMFSIWERT